MLTKEIRKLSTSLSTWKSWFIDKDELHSRLLDLVSLRIAHYDAVNIILTIFLTAYFFEISLVGNANNPFNGMGIIYFGIVKILIVSKIFYTIMRKYVVHSLIDHLIFWWFIVYIIASAYSGIPLESLTFELFAAGACVFSSIYCLKAFLLRQDEVDRC